MERTFPKTLSTLRKERNISQRQAAADLHISQALLSHYENGAREPGLGFVCKACDYYQVSADYLLCRCEEPEGAKRIARTALEMLDSLAEWEKRSRKQLEKIEETLC